MSLYPNIKESSSESNEETDFMNLLSREIDTSNPDLVTIFSQLQKHPNSISHLKSFILALLRTKSLSGITERLASYLISHVTLLEAISHNVELASLFLISENGKQTFTSVHKAFLKEQASRTRVFLQENGFDNVSNSNHLSDYKYYISQIDSIDERLSELDIIAKDAFKSKNVNSLKNAFKEVYSLLAGCMIFNDVVLRNQSNKSSDSMRMVHNAFPDSPQDTNEFIKWIKQLIEERDSSIKNIKTFNIEQSKMYEKINNLETELQTKTKRTKISTNDFEETHEALVQKVSDLQRQLNDFHQQFGNKDTESVELQRLRNKFQKNERENNINFKSLESENSSLRSKIDDLLQKLSKKESKISILKSKIEQFSVKSEDAISSEKQTRYEISDLQRLYNSTSSSLFKEQEKSRFLTNQVERLQKELDNVVQENKELRSLLERSKQSVQEQMEENTILLKQMRRDSQSNSKETIENLTNKVSKLKYELCQSKKFICKLQKQIEDFRKKHRDCHEESTTYHHKSSKSTKENQDYKEHISYKKHKNVQILDSSSCYSSNSFEFESNSNVSDLDKEIEKLEKNVKISRKILQENTKFSK